jgi:hypothetical protein
MSAREIGSGKIVPLNCCSQGVRQLHFDDSLLLQPLIVKNQDALCPPFAHATLHGAQLRVGKLRGIAFLQLLEDGLGGPAGIGCEPAADLLPDRLKGIGPRAPSVRCGRLSRPTIAPRFCVRYWRQVCFGCP